MRKIDKGTEPASLALWKRSNPGGIYDDLERQERQDIRQDIRRSCASEQYYLCAYCCGRISGESADTMNEHVVPRSAPVHGAKLSVDYSNIVASCTRRNQCDDSHKAQHLPLTPLMNECETEFRFRLSGKIEGLTERAKTTINVLNLGDCASKNRALIEKRKKLISGLLYQEGTDPEDISNEDDDILTILLEQFEHPVRGKLEPFAPCLVNILKGLLAP
ncbi:hypothetical protein KIH87_13595 [Paraneptunicella aestuarii]|uniref:hypothetical protein n=1 Tax=Paraneptunicella aestuarii TaxID=2831148 RepID=UPI001E38B3D6|nr:hypothetical protein [Paraneptunicella aestuarii]UAA37735.1 hypothetical protein KIH87_13595 [Paraneptunicella aestuarii]